MSNNYILTRNGSFITVSDDELYHYKYIKREKVNGKWRYYYKDDKYDKSRDNLNAAKREVEFRDGQLWLTKRQSNKAWKDVESAREKGLDYYDNERLKAEKYYDSTHDDVVYAYENYFKAKRDLEKAQTDHEATKLKYEKSVGKKVADKLNKVSDTNNTKAAKKVEAARMDVADAKKAYDKASKEYSKAYDTMLENTNVTKDGWKLMKKARADLSDKEQEAFKTKRAAEKRYEDAKAAYEKTANYKVSKLRDNSAAKIDEAKTYVSNLFTRKKKK